MKYFSLKKRNGYTLLELLISISIFVIISVVVVNNFRQGQKMDDLRTGAVELVNNFREVQNLGMSGQVVKVCKGGDRNLLSCTNDTECESLIPPNGTCGLVPIGGFGIVLDKLVDDSSARCHESTLMECPTTYTLFADIGGITGKFNAGTDIPLDGKENYSLPNNVRIKDYLIKCSWINSPGDSLCPDADFNGIDVSFRPPKPTPFFVLHIDDPVIYYEQTIKILLEHKTTHKCRMVMINGVSGEVSESANPGCLLQNL
ncbi:MAG: prepilin-type N-terminal cleavage/methylation domain-containing protein [Patescibacteria group bacterium]|jgi:prepilin-type N-terminal cleavage/methylation domain-containing protein